MQNVVRDGNYGRAKDTQKIYSKYIYNRVTIFDEWIKRISPSFLPVVKIWFSIKKKKGKEKRGSSRKRGKWNRTKRFGKTWSNLVGEVQRVGPAIFSSFSFSPRNGGRTVERRVEGGGALRNRCAKTVVHPGERCARKGKKSGGEEKEAGEEAREGLTRQALTQWH